MVILLLFVIAQWCGLRDTTNILSGTVQYQSNELLYAVIYLFLYCSAVILAPVLLLTFLLINGIHLMKRLFFK